MWSTIEIAPVTGCDFVFARNVRWQRVNALFGYGTKISDADGMPFIRSSQLFETGMTCRQFFSSSK